MPSPCRPPAGRCSVSLSLCLPLLLLLTSLLTITPSLAAADLHQASGRAVIEVGCRTWRCSHLWRSMASVGAGEAFARKGMLHKQDTDFLGDYTPSPNVDTRVASPHPSPIDMQGKNGNTRKLLQDYTPMANSNPTSQHSG